MPERTEERLDEQIHEAAQQLALVVVMAKTLDVDAVGEVARESSRFDTLVSMIDPTRWMREHGAVEASSKVARAFLEFRRVIDEVSPR